MSRIQIEEKLKELDVMGELIALIPENEIQVFIESEKGLELGIMLSQLYYEEFKDIPSDNVLKVRVKELLSSLLIKV